MPVVQPSVRERHAKEWPENANSIWIRIEAPPGYDLGQLKNHCNALEKLVEQKASVRIKGSTVASGIADAKALETALNDPALQPQRPKTTK